MKRTFIKFLSIGLFVGFTSFASFAQDATAETNVTTSDSALATSDSVMSETDTAVAEATTPTPAEEAPIQEAAEPTFTEVIKGKIIEGGTGFMSIVLICLILGLAIAIERVITLNLANMNYKKLLADVKYKLMNEGVDAAKDLCARTKGPVAAIFAQGFVRSDEGIAAVEKSVESYGSSEMNKLEKGMTWVSLFISLAPMFGFMGTVIGMIDAFDVIEQAEDIKIDQVAGGIKVALLTTVAGLIVAVILQVFYNYLSSTIDSIAGKMEDASNEFIDLLVASGKVKK